MSAYCIVGAGPAGLAAARAFKREGLDFKVYERLSGVGGIWDFSNLDSPVYANTHFISSAKMSGFEGFPMPARYPDYPRHDQVLTYLRAFAREYELLPYIQTNTHVQSIEPLRQGVEIVFHDGRRTRCRGVVVATGHNWDPRSPRYPGAFTGEQIHALRYRSPESYRGRRVLVVGGGNSACDIACDVASTAERVMLSLRRGYHFLPKHVLGVPTDEFAQSGRASGAAFTMMLRMMSAKLARHGVPAPDHRLFEANPVVNSRIIEHIIDGTVTVKPNVARLCGAEVRFGDDSREPVDSIIYATGYRFTTPVKAGAVKTGVVKAGVVEGGVVEAGVVEGGVVEAGVVEGGVVEAGVVEGGVVEAGVVEGGVVEAGGGQASDPVTGVVRAGVASEVDGSGMFLNIFHPGRSDLAVMGMFETDGGAFPIFSAQADLIARVMAARERSATLAERFEALRRGPAPDLSGGRRYIDSERHSISVDRRIYMQQLRAALQIFS